MNEETSEQRVKREIENDIKQVLKAISKNNKKGKKLTTNLRELFIQQDCKHKWRNTNLNYPSDKYKCDICGRKNLI